LLFFNYDTNQISHKQYFLICVTLLNGLLISDLLEIRVNLPSLFDMKYLILFKKVMYLAIK